MLTVTYKQFIHAILTLALAGEAFVKWYEIDGFDDQDDILVFIIEAPTARLPHLFRMIYTIFPEYEVTLADSSFRSGNNILSTGHEVIKSLHGVSMEIGIRAPRKR